MDGKEKVEAVAVNWVEISRARALYWVVEPYVEDSSCTWVDVETGNL